eukprot:365757-Chlamydomonas_euryale.AAC.3
MRGRCRCGPGAQLSTFLRFGRDRLRQSGPVSVEYFHTFRGSRTGPPNPSGSSKNVTGPKCGARTASAPTLPQWNTTLEKRCSSVWRVGRACKPGAMLVWKGGHDVFFGLLLYGCLVWTWPGAGWASTASVRVRTTPRPSLGGPVVVLIDTSVETRESGDRRNWGWPRSEVHY